MTKKFDLKPTLVLSAICVVMVALLAVVNLFTAPVIRAQQEAAANEALLEVLPEGKNFKDVDLTQYTLPASIEKAWSADGGYVFQSNVTGYKSGLIIMCGIGSDGKITGAAEVIPGLLPARHHTGEQKKRGPLSGIPGDIPNRRHKEQLQARVHRLFH